MVTLVISFRNSVIQFFSSVLNMTATWNWIFVNSCILYEILSHAITSLFPDLFISYFNSLKSLLHFRLTKNYFKAYLLRKGEVSCPLRLLHRQ